MADAATLAGCGLGERFGTRFRFQFANHRLDHSPTGRGARPISARADRALLSAPSVRLPGAVRAPTSNSSIDFNRRRDGAGRIGTVRDKLRLGNGNRDDASVCEISIVISTPLPMCCSIALRSGRVTTKNSRFISTAAMRCAPSSKQAAALS